jgi:FKBP-type peptidyl-prolyl cis-trans isomerase FklB
MPTSSRFRPIARHLLALGCVCGVAIAAHAQPGEPLAPPAAAKPDADPAATGMGYALGYQIGTRIRQEHRQMGTGIDYAALARGLADAVKGDRPALKDADFRRALQNLEAEMERREREFAERMQAAARKNLAAGNTYIEAKEGAGAKPARDHVVVAHYTGRHIDGTEFDGTDPNGEPASFPVTGVVPGWQEALPLMKAGSKWRIHLPAALGYGERGSPPTIEPNEVLVFEIELISSALAPAGQRAP